MPGRVLRLLLKLIVVLFGDLTAGEECSGGGGVLLCKSYLFFGDFIRQNWERPDSYVNVG